MLTEGFSSISAGPNGTRVGAAPVAVTVDSLTHRVFVVNRDSSSVSVLDTIRDKVVSTITVPATPDAVAVVPSTNRVFVNSQAGQSVAMLNARTGALIAMIPAQPGSLVVDECERYSIYGHLIR